MNHAQLELTFRPRHSYRNGSATFRLLITATPFLPGLRSLLRITQPHTFHLTISPLALPWIQSFQTFAMSCHTRVLLLV